MLTRTCVHTYPKNKDINSNDILRRWFAFGLNITPTWVRAPNWTRTMPTMQICHTMTYPVPASEPLKR